MRYVFEFRTVGEGILADLGGASPHNHVLQAGATFKSVIADVLCSAGDADLFQAGAALEGIISNVSVTPENECIHVRAALECRLFNHFAAAWNAYIIEARAVLKCIPLYARDIAPDNDSAHVGAVFKG